MTQMWISFPLPCSSVALGSPGPYARVTNNSSTVAAPEQAAGVKISIHPSITQAPYQGSPRVFWINFRLVLSQSRQSAYLNHSNHQ